MGSFNKALLLGHVGQDPDVRYTQSGTPVASFSLATNEHWKDREGIKQERTEWHNCVAWSRLAELVEQYVHKGTQLLVEGKIQTRSWDAESGQKRYRTEVVAERVQFVGNANGNSLPPVASSENPSDSVSTPDDIPF